MSGTFLTVIMPALDEEKNIVAAIEDTLRAFDSCAFKGELIVVNDGSTDRTEELVQAVMERDSRVACRAKANPSRDSTDQFSRAAPFPIR